MALAEVAVRDGATPGVVWPRRPRTPNGVTAVELHGVEGHELRYRHGVAWPEWPRTPWIPRAGMDNNARRQPPRNFRKILGGCRGDRFSLVFGVFPVRGPKPGVKEPGLKTPNKVAEIATGPTKTWGCLAGMATQSMNSKAGEAKLRAGTPAHRRTRARARSPVRAGPRGARMSTVGARSG